MSNDRNDATTSSSPKKFMNMVDKETSSKSITIPEILKRIGVLVLLLALWLLVALWLSGAIFV